MNPLAISPWSYKGNRRGSRLRVGVMLVAVMFIAAMRLAAPARAEVVDAAGHWLMKINHASASVSFSGIFVYSHDGQVESMQVVRRIRHGKMQERLYSLNGETREVVRDADRVWRYMPAQNVGVHDYHVSLASGFPRILPADLNRLRRNYHFIEGGISRVADRKTRRIDVIPNDGYRYGYRLWADIESGLLLCSELVGEDGQVVEQYLFVRIDIDGEISDRALQAVTSKDQLVWYGDGMPQPATALADSKWRFRQLPDGYRLSQHIRRMSPLEGTEIEQLIFSDGLSTVSVFIKPIIKSASAEPSGMQGLSRMGAVHVYRHRMAGHRITVMGEAPAKTVEYLAAGATYEE